MHMQGKSCDVMGAWSPRVSLLLSRSFSMVPADPPCCQLRSLLMDLKPYAPTTPHPSTSPPAPRGALYPIWAAETVQLMLGSAGGGIRAENEESENLGVMGGQWSPCTLF